MVERIPRALGQPSRSALSPQAVDHRRHLYADRGGDSALRAQHSPPAGIRMDAKGARELAAGAAAASPSHRGLSTQAIGVPPSRSSGMP